jgi:hypothetical protein
MKRVEPDDDLLDEVLDADLAPVPWREKQERAKSKWASNPPRRLD